MLVWFLLLWVVESQVPLTGTIRILSSVPADSNTLPTTSSTPGLAQTSLDATGRPVFTKPDYEPLFSTSSQNTIAYTIPVSTTSTANMFQFSAEPFYNSSEKFTYELQMDISSATLNSKTLTFNSGGDLWVYFGHQFNNSRIAGYLAVDLGGPHNKLAANYSLNWNTFRSTYLGTANAVVRMYVFYAHRTLNTPHLTITFANQMRCDAETVGVLVPNLNLSALDTAGGVGASVTQTMNGEPALVVLSNTSSGGQFEAAYAWFPKVQRITSGFVTHFEYLLQGKPNGFAFVFHNFNRRTAAVGGGGSNLGYAGQGFANQAAVEFDVYQDSLIDPAPNRVELHTKYEGENTASPTPEVTQHTQYNGPALVSTVWTPVIISYAPTGVLTVWLNGTMRYNASIDHSRVLSGIGENVYFGFTTSNGPATDRNNVFIRRWRLWTTPLSGLRSTVTNVTTSWNRPRANDNDATVDLYATTRDPCDRLITLNGLSSPFSVSTTMNAPGVASYSFVNNGRYNLFYYSTITGTYSLSVSFDGQPLAGSPYPITVVADVVSQYSSFNVTAGLNNSKVIAGRPITLVITARDRFKNLNYETPIPFPFLANWASEPTSMATLMSAPYYTVQLTTTIASEPLSRGVFVSFNGNPLDSTFSAVVIAGDVDADRTQFDLPGGQFQNIVAGQLTRMTITPYDKDRNRIQSNPGGAISFSMHLPGPILVNATELPIPWTDDLTYAVFPHWEFTFTALTAGRYTFYITYAGSLVFETGVSPVVVAGPIAGVQQPNVPATVVSGLEGGFTLLTQDLYGNLRTDPSGLTLVVGLNGVNTTCGTTATNTNGVGITQFGCSYQGSFSGRYGVFFTPTLQQNLTVNVYLGGQRLPVSGEIVVASGPPDPTQSSITSATSSIAAGSQGSLVISLKDVQGNPVYGRAGDIRDGLLFVQITGSSSLTAALLFNSTEETTPGVYTLPFTATLVGNLVWGASISGNAQSILSSGVFSTNVVPGTPAPSRFLISGPGLATQQVENSLGEVYVALRDAYDNVISGTNLSANFVVSLVPATDPVNIIFSSGASFEYTIVFRNPPIELGPLLVTVRYSGTIIKGGNFSVTGVTDANTNATCVPGSVNVSVAGAPLNIPIQDKVPYEQYGGVAHVFSAEFSLEGVRVQAQTVTIPTEPTSNIWHAIFPTGPTKVGTYLLHLFLSGQASTECNPCSYCNLTVVPSTPAMGYTQLTADSSPKTVGEGFYVNITVKDQYNNLIPNPPNLTLTSTTATNFTDIHPVGPGIISVFVTTFVATPWDMKVYYGSTLIVSRVFVSVAGTPASATIIGFAANGTYEGVAGLPYNPSAGFRGFCLVLQDRYSQPITDSSYNNQFSMLMQPPTEEYNVSLGAVLTTSFDGTACYQLSFVPTIINPLGATPFQVWYQNTMLVQHSGVFVPGNLDVSKVVVIGLRQNYSVSEAFQFSVLLVDSYGNNISTAVNPLFGTIASAPARARSNIPLTGAFQSPMWGFTYPGTTNSPGEITYAGNWSIAFTYKGNTLALGEVNKFPLVISVAPGPTIATNTIISLPVISSNNALNGTQGLVAGTLGTWSYALYDRYMNPTIGINNDDVLVSFVEGIREYSICNQTSINFPASNNTISSTGAQGLNFTVGSDGQGTIYTTFARQVVMFFQVNGQYIYIGPCINVQEAFTVHPAEEDPENTLIDGPGLKGGVAGSFLSFVVVLRDRFGNFVNRGDATVQFGPNNQTTCTESNVLTVTNQSLVSNHFNGTYTSTFQTTQAQSFLLLVSIDGKLAGSNTTCTIVVVSPWYADSAIHSVQTTPLIARAGSPATVQIQAKDLYDNVVTNQGVYHGHTFLTSVDRSLCPLYVKRTNNVSAALLTNAGAPWIGWDSAAGITSGCVSGANNSHLLAAQALRSAINSNHCFQTCTANCLQLGNSSETSDLELYNLGSTTTIGNGDKACTIFRDETVNSYNFAYHIDSSTANCPVAPCYSDNSTSQTSQQAFFIPEYPGHYSGVFLLVPDPKCVGCQPRFLTTTVGFQVDPATCGQVNGSTPYRCLNGTCVSSRSDCLETCPDATPYKCYDGSCSSTSCLCPPGSFQCAGTSHCVDDAARCPAADILVSVCPVGTVSCWSGVCAPTATQCPSARVCPPTFVLCADSQTCVRNASQCTSSPPCASGFQCQNGYCVNEGESCPSIPSCGSDVICPDGSCRASSAACEDVGSCFAPLSFRCSDGSCRASSSDCPTSVTCPLGLILCPSGVCSKSCVMSTTGCSHDEVRCPDGSCRNNEGLCPTRTTCPSTKPVLCPDGSCVASVWSCAQPPFCNNTLCSNGFCVGNASQCPTLVTCPFTAPVKCPNGQCQTDASKCAVQPACPFVQCPDGSCRREYADCPTLSTCPIHTPVRCGDGSCQAGAYACPQPSCGSLFRCPGGECVETRAQCPTHVTCPPTFLRCVDGSCRSSCARVSVAKCPANQIECPQGAYGLTCATDISQCPYAATCPSDRPVRCLDATCVFAAKDCISTSSVPDDKTACPDGGWASNGPDNCYPGVTCPPSAPVKCWDNSCRQIAEDCPKQAPCPISLGGRYLCSDGTCARTLDLCASRGTRCANGLIKCPFGGCAASPALCPNTTLSGCPDQTTLCMDGSCRRTPSIWCRPLLCPLSVPYLCDNGACVTDATKCPKSNGCPYNRPIKCLADGSCVSAESDCAPPPQCNGSQALCLDGTGCSADCGCNSTDASCTAPQANGCKSPGDVRCHDGVCKPSHYCTGKMPANLPADMEIAPGFQGSNLCPMSRPFRCPDGLCAVSMTRCPVYPVPTTPPCPLTTPFKCANGLCVMSGAECPVLADCPKQNGIKRCPNGHCDTVCPSVNTCPSTQSHRCENGMCVAKSDLCINAQNNNCPTNHTICPDGHCRLSDSSCPPLRQANGCAAGLTKCEDGSCEANCTRVRRCPSTHPYICSGACSVEPCVGGKMSNGCDVAAPFRCANGQCKKYPARLGNQTSDRCAPTLVCDGLKPVLCGDGTCVALAKHCRPIICDTILCPDGTCSASCPAPLTTCPVAQPVLCPDGSCRSTFARCGNNRVAVPCAAPTAHQCWDGSCKASLLECAKQTAKLTASPFTGTELATTICTSGVLCPNGMCGFTPEDCDIVPSCAPTAPFRCWNGGCYSSQSDCPAFVACSDKALSRCEDGTCRKTCLNYNGCPLSQPYMCLGRTTMCVANATFCNTQSQVACSSDCNRDIAASKQSVTIVSDQDTVVEVGLKHNSPRLRVTFHSGSFQGTSPALVDIVPARISDLPLSARVLSTPFIIQSQSKLAMDLTVDADIDWKRFEGSSSTVAAAAISCELQANYDVTTSYEDESGAKGTCTGQANITAQGVGIRLDASGTTCAAVELQSTFTNQTILTAWNEATQSSVSCLCTLTQNNTNLCYRAVRNRAQVTMSAYTNGRPGCPSESEVTAGAGVVSYNFNPAQNSVDACYLIVRAAFFADVDICLGVLTGNRFRCLETRADRVGRDWNSPFDQPGIRRVGRVRTLGQAYAFVFSPLPPDEVIYVPEVTWWELYGTATLASSITFGVVFICVAVVLFYFNRFRRKYKEEQEHMDYLQDKVAELDQFAGGLGMTDEGGEFDMVANPMVIEIEALQKQVETVNDALHGQAEEDAQEIDALELERQQLFAEIQRVKEAIANNEKGKAPKRVVEASPSTYEAPAVVAAISAPKTVRQTNFGQVRATRKPKDIE